MASAAPKFFRSAAAFGKWLAAHGTAEAELLVGFHKVDSGRPCMTWSESVDAALCHGWIDGVRRRIDDASYSIRFTPRRPTSIWSAINIAKIEALRAEGRLRPAGERAFAERKATKSAIYSYETDVVSELSPAEVRAFRRDKAAWKYFDAALPGYRKQLLHWVTRAKKAETRASRLATLVEACAAGTRLR